MFFSKNLMLYLLIKPYKVSPMIKSSRNLEQTPKCIILLFNGLYSITNKVIEISLDFILGDELIL